MRGRVEGGRALSGERWRCGVEGESVCAGEGESGSGWGEAGRGESEDEREGEGGGCWEEEKLSLRMVGRDGERRLRDVEDFADLEESAGRRFMAGCLGVRPRGYSVSGTNSSGCGVMGAECPLTVRMLLLALRDGVEASRRRPWELDFWSGIGSEIGMLFVRSYGGFSYVGRFGEGGGTLYIECAYPGAGISSSNSGCGGRC